MPLGYRRFLRRLCLVLSLLSVAWGTAARAATVDLELVLAVDSSSSVTAEEFDLQMRGIANAFRHPAVVGAIEAAGDLGIAVSLVQWSDNRRQFLAIDWMHLTDAESAEAFAEEIDATPRFVIGGGTAIGGAMSYSTELIDRNEYSGRRKVVDISGDGRANQGAQPDEERDKAVAAGFTINGLAILNEDFLVDRYYLYNVIGGTGAFLVTAEDFEDFQEAILRKLIQEISGVPLAALEIPGKSRVALAPRPEDPEAPDAPGRGLGGP